MTKAQLHMMFVLLNVTMELSNVGKIKVLPNVRNVR